jgi:hypothetical protein
MPLRVHRLDRRRAVCRPSMPGLVHQLPVGQRFPVEQDGQRVPEEVRGLLHWLEVEGWAYRAG